MQGTHSAQNSNLSVCVFLSNFFEPKDKQRLMWSGSGCKNVSHQVFMGMIKVLGQATDELVRVAQVSAKCHSATT